MRIHETAENRLNPNAGIAIGPILFIIAILAILAAAIAAGSGSFTSGTTKESATTKSSALIQIGDTLKVGMDRIVMEGQVADPTSVTTDVTVTTGTTALFSPTGGGVSPPSPAMANTPGVDVWYFPTGVVKGIGTGGTNYDVLAVLPVSAGVCAEVNNKTTGTATTPSAAALGDFTSVTAGAVTGGTAWPASLSGLATGCVNSSDVTVSTSGSSPSSAYFFYQVLAIQ